MTPLLVWLSSCGCCCADHCRRPADSTPSPKSCPSATATTVPGRPPPAAAKCPRGTVRIPVVSSVNVRSARLCSNWAVSRRNESACFSSALCTAGTWSAAVTYRPWTAVCRSSAHGVCHTTYIHRAACKTMAKHRTSSSQTVHSQCSKGGSHHPKGCHTHNCARSHNSTDRSCASASRSSDACCDENIRHTHQLATTNRYATGRRRRTSRVVGGRRRNMLNGGAYRGLDDGSQHPSQQGAW